MQAKNKQLLQARILALVANSGIKTIPVPAALLQQKVLIKTKTFFAAGDEITIDGLDGPNSGRWLNGFAR